MRGVAIYVAPFVVELRIPTLFPPDELTLGLEYLISFEGLNVSPEMISLGAEAVLVVVDIVLVAGFVIGFVVMLYRIMVYSEFNFLFSKNVPIINQKS
jgi:hypothetical protein